MGGTPFLYAPRLLFDAVADMIDKTEWEAEYA
jgi:hypothetical protein